MLESDLMKNIMKTLSAHGKVFRVNNGAFYTKDGRYIPASLPKGFSDLIFIKDGSISFVEVKVKPNKPTADQIHFIENMRKQGCRAGVAYSEDEAREICGIAV
jgi:hypothetical protein